LVKAETRTRIRISGRGLIKLLGLLFLITMASSCAVLQPKPLSTDYYTIPSVTYFRDSPGYASRNVATVYRGQQVKILSRMANSDWCQVQTMPGGQVGWIQRPLLSPVPIPTETYTIQQAEVQLRDVPQKDALARRVLHRGDKVRKLSENQQGWWWVLVEKDESLGWLPGNVLAEQTPTPATASPVAAPAGTGSSEVKAVPPPAPQPYLYVATATLDLHLLPLVSSQVVKVLKFKDKVERVAQSGVEWVKVRYSETGAQGWVQGPTLTTSPSQTPKIYPPPKKRRVLKRPRRLQPAGQETPQPSSQPEVVEPEAM
jgi:uncharacterized protein YgiM (DUF1202 family)